MAVRTETFPPGGSASELASRVAPRRRGATVLAYAVTTAGDGPTSRRTNIAISRGGSRPSGAAASPRLSRSGLFSTGRRGNFPACKALKTQEMRKFSPSSLRAERENGLRPRGRARLRRILAGRGVSRCGARKFSWLQSIENSRNRENYRPRLSAREGARGPARLRRTRAPANAGSRGEGKTRNSTARNPPFRSPGSRRDRTLGAERSRPEMAPQRLEKIESAPGNGRASEASKPQHLVHGRAGVYAALAPDFTSL